MRGAEGVVLALRALGEAGQATPLAQRADAVPPARDALVRLGLMADVPDQAITRRVENPMEGDRQLDDPEAGPEMTTRHRNGFDRFLAQLGGKLRQVFLGDLAQVLRNSDAVEQWCCAIRSHENPYFVPGVRSGIEADHNVGGL